MNSEKEGPSVIPLADFDACVLDAPIASLNKVDMTSVSQAYLQASATTLSPFQRNRGDSSQSRRTWQDLGAWHFVRRSAFDDPE
jgi:hypothetical protein